MKSNKYFKILIVDDSPELLDLAMRALNKTEYILFSAVNGADCMEVLHKEKPDILLLDVMLPDTNGKDLCNLIKKDPEFSEVYIILLSSLRTSSDNVSEGLECGADGYIRRPVDKRELLAMVEAACRIITAENRIRAEKILLEACINSPADVIVVAIDMQYNYLTFNSYHKEVMLNTYGTEVKLGMNLLDCMTIEEDIIKAKINYDMALEGVSHIKVDKYGDKDPQYYETRYNPIYNEKHEILGVTAFASNITERKRIEEKLLFISKAVEATTDAIGISDAQGHHFFQNKALSDLFEYANAAEIESAGGGSVVVQNPDIAKELFDKIMSGNSWSGNLEMVTKSGRVFSAYERADAIKDNEGNIIGLIGIITDNTERNKVQESLRKSEEKFRKAFATNPDAITITRFSDGKIVSINGGFTKITGYSEYETRNKTSDELNIWSDSSSREWIISALKKEGRFNDLEGIFRHKDGSLRNGIMSASIIDLDNIPHIFSITRDITHLKHAEEDLRVSELQYRSLMEQASDGIFIADGNGNYVDVNNSGCKMLGYSRKEILSLNLRDLVTPEEVAKKPLQIDKLHIGRSLLSERRMIRKDRTLLDVEISGKMLSDGRFQGIVRDITDRKNDEKELHNKVRELEWLNKMMMNREIRMIELKKEVNALLNNKGEKDKYVIHKLNE